MSQAYQLMHEGCIALAAVESNGMRVNMPYLDRMQQVAKTKIKELKEKLEATDVWKLWKKHYKDKANLGSRMQLGHVIFDLLGTECNRRTPTGRPGTAEEDLEDVDHPFVNDYLRMGKLAKLQATYLQGIRREVEDDGFLHPFFSLNLVSSYRSSSDSPNFQNLPSREPEFAKVVRRAFIPREGHVWVEIDYGALEVHIGCAYHKDPKMIQFLEEKHDFHKDFAAQCFLLPHEQVNSVTRYVTKNKFVFPEFYGSYFGNISPPMWKTIHRLKLQTVDGIPMFDHLASQGIKDFSAFEDHIASVEEKLWKVFPRYAKWKEWYWKEYLRRGWLAYKTGFVVRGVYRRNQVLNIPIQGAAFHCLLWSLIQLQKWLTKSRMKSKIVAEIHDSMFIDAHRSELHDVVAKAVQISTKDIREHWKWILTPLEVDVKVCENNWYEKKDYVLN